LPDTEREFSQEKINCEWQFSTISCMKIDHLHAHLYKWNRTTMQIAPLSLQVKQNYRTTMKIAPLSLQVKQNYNKAFKFSKYPD